MVCVSGNQGTAGKAGGGGGGGGAGGSDEDDWQNQYYRGGGGGGGGGGGCGGKPGTAIKPGGAPSLRIVVALTDKPQEGRDKNQ